MLEPGKTRIEIYQVYMQLAFRLNVVNAVQDSSVGYYPQGLVYHRAQIGCKHFQR